MNPPKELTLRGLVLGALLTTVFTAANVYLGLKVGLTFASSIPAAVISMAILSAVKDSTIQENNIVQTVASAAGTLSAIIFILPGLVIVGWWTGFPFWQSFLICLSGGILGVLFTIPLRRALVTDSDLPYPEGVAAAEVLKVGAGTRGETKDETGEAREGLVAVILGSVTTIYAVIGSTAVPVSYLVAAGILSIFTVGFVAMSRHIVNSGAFYSYISHGLGRVIGVGAAFVALPAYALMQVGLFGLFGVVGSGILDSFGFTVSWFVCALVAWAIVAVLGVLWVDLSGRVLGVLLVAEISLVLFYDLIMTIHPAGGHVSFATLSPAKMIDPQAAALLVVAIAGFVGFEATVVLSEEARDPKRTIARATHWAVIIPGAVIGLSAWAMSVSTGPGNIVAAAKDKHTDLVFSLISTHVPQVFVSGKMRSRNQRE